MVILLFVVGIPMETNCAPLVTDLFIVLLFGNVR